MILIVSPSAHYPSHNWPNTVALAHALMRKGRPVKIVIFNSTADVIPADLQDKVTVAHQRLPAAWRRYSTGAWQHRRLAGLIKVYETLACIFRAWRLSRRQPDAVLHVIGDSHWTVVVATFLFRRHLVYTLFGGILSGRATGAKKMRWKFLALLLRRAAATGRLDFACENELIRDEAAVHVGRHIRLIPYAINDDEELVPQAEARKRLGLPLTEKIVLFFGTHRREKDYLTPLKGLATLPSPPLALFAGKVISENDPNLVIAKCHYPNAKVVNEFVPEDMTKFYFAAADALVLPYDIGLARGSGVLIECCRYLRPVIVSQAPFFVTFLSRYPCGVAYVHHESASFAEAAQRLLANTSVFQAALERARRDHSWSSAADKYLDLYGKGGAVT